MGTTTVEPGAATPGPKTNRIGLTVIDYKGGKTTLCAGCGHNAISERIIEAMYEDLVETYGDDGRQIIECAADDQ